MSYRQISPHRHPRSSLYWFRLVVPERYRVAVGQREIKTSLGTSDIAEARRLCAIRHGEWRERFLEIEAQLIGSLQKKAVDIVDRFLAAQGAQMGSVDRAVDYELQNLAIAEECIFYPIGLDIIGIDEAPRVDDPRRHPVYAGVDEGILRGRREALSGSGPARILPGVEAARRILAAELWSITLGFLDAAFEHAGEPVPENEHLLAAAARRFLTRLLEQDRARIAGLERAFPSPCALPNAGSQNPVPAAAESARQDAVQAGDPTLRELIHGAASGARTITEVFAAWAAAQPPEKTKIVDEWNTSIVRFVDLFGDVDVDVIHPDMVRDFRDAMGKMPVRPKKAVAALPVREQIAIARDKKLPCLQDETIAKHVSGLRVTLDYAKDPLRIIMHNPASEVTVAKSRGPATGIKRRPFDEDDLAIIFSSAEMSDPAASNSIDEFWFVLLAGLTGLRPTEIGKLRPGNIKHERGVPYIAVELDSARIHEEAVTTGKVGKTAKTETSLRDVPVHSVLIEAGFLEFVVRQKERGAEWLLQSLHGDAYGSRSKYLSQKLNRWIRALGIQEKEKVFYSFRHAMKRSCRNSSMKEEIADLLAGHAPVSVGRKYGAGAAIHVLKQAVEEISYPSVDWGPVIACARARLLLGSRVAPVASEK